MDICSTPGGIVSSIAAAEESLRSIAVSLVVAEAGLIESAAESRQMMESYGIHASELARDLDALEASCRVSLEREAVVVDNALETLANATAALVVGRGNAEVSTSATSLECAQALIKTVRRPPVIRLIPLDNPPTPESAAKKGSTEVHTLRYRATTLPKLCPSDVELCSRDTLCLALTQSYVLQCLGEGELEYAIKELTSRALVVLAATPIE